ncbi:pisatin demethylase [Penicillium angulare]|uniref:pisatin demethylase n=1 Tax=Penicillium angulare TaxID=116970 RepID=UPI002540249E|nr:pisatin demethylase [Penicillium angulare]KAJ5279236.1 pisatin demethylase [Penicillium angulare]
MVLWYKGKSISGLEAILDENEHTAVKRMVLKGFTPSSVATYESKIDQVTLEFINQVGKRGNFDAGEWFVYYFADMMNDVAFSAKPGFMDHGIDVDGSLHITKVITQMWARVHAIPTIMSWLSWTMGFLVGLNWKIVRLGRDCLNARLEKPDSQKIDLLNLYIEAGEQRPDMISPERVLGMTLSTIIGGSDITAFTVTYGLSEIVRNRDILDNIEREMKEASEMQELSYPPTLKELAKLPYINAVIKESLRLAAPVQFNLDRVTPSDGLEMSGTLIPGGTTVGCLPGVINRDESVFGLDSDDFRPERWTEASQESLGRMDRGLMTFGMGKHLCIGQHFAIAQMRKIIATLLMHFEVSATNPNAELVCSHRIHLHTVAFIDLHHYILPQLDLELPNIQVESSLPVSDMPPKRRGAPPSTSAGPKRARPSKLAKDNNISAEEENEIKEVFQLFADKHKDFPNEKEGVIPREDVRKALVALGLPPEDSTELSEILSALDPTLTGYIPYSPFVSVAAAKLRSRDDDSMAAEVDDAYNLFTKGSTGPISLGHLRRIARELKEDSVDDNLLKDMIMEANGGAGLNAGVTLEQFHDVMSRAGVF